jgi:hypothetical protein
MVKVTDTRAATPNEGMLLVDLGKQKRKQVKRLRNGTGKLVGEVQRCIQELQAAGKLSESSQPVIVIVREKRQRLRLF